MLLAGGAGAMAQRLEPCGKRAGDFVIGGTPQASDAASPLLDGTYFFTPNIALDLIAATTRHKLTVTNSALGRSISTRSSC